jgi:hypothetical protein
MSPNKSILLQLDSTRFYFGKAVQNFENKRQTSLIGLQDVLLLKIWIKADVRMSPLKGVIFA